MKYKEDELIALLKQGNREAFDVLYEMYSRTLYGIILKIVYVEEFAQDVLQDSYVKIWKNIPRYDASKGRLFTWMLNIVRNTAIDFNRSKHIKYKNRFDDEIVSNNVQYSENSSVNAIGLKDVVSNLEPKHKAVIDALYFSGLTHKEAAEQLKIPIGTIKTRANTAMKILRDVLKVESNGY